jgi:hypothetical protein
MLVRIFQITFLLFGHKHYERKIKYLLLWMLIPIELIVKMLERYIYRFGLKIKTEEISQNKEVNE